MDNSLEVKKKLVSYEKHFNVHRWSSEIARAHSREDVIYYPRIVTIVIVCPNFLFFFLVTQPLSQCTISQICIRLVNGALFAQFKAHMGC